MVDASDGHLTLLQNRPKTLLSSWKHNYVLWYFGHLLSAHRRQAAAEATTCDSEDKTSATSNEEFVFKRAVTRSRDPKDVFCPHNNPIFQFIRRLCLCHASQMCEALSQIAQSPNKVASESESIRRLTAIRQPDLINRRACRSIHTRCWAQLSENTGDCSFPRMEERVPLEGVMQHTISSERLLQEGAAVADFLESRSEQSFADLFRIYTPQLISFFRARGCDAAVCEELGQEVMFIVYRKADQLRDRILFRGWLFKVARNVLCRHYGKQSREVDTIELERVADRLVAFSNAPAAMPASEFLHWMSFLDSGEQEALILRFVEGWEYHEIAAEKAIPIGTVQWRVFNAKRKLAPHLKAIWRDSVVTVPSAQSRSGRAVEHAVRRAC